jgi:hypothetical protein
MHWRKHIIICLLAILPAFVFAQIPADEKKASADKDSYTLGMEYYNSAMGELLKLEPGADAMEIIEIHEKSYPLFLKALPYLKECFKADPNNEEVEKAMMYTYTALDMEKALVEEYHKRMMSRIDSKTLTNRNNNEP